MMENLSLDKLQWKRFRFLRRKGILGIKNVSLIRNYYRLSMPEKPNDTHLMTLAGPMPVYCSRFE
jgi:hypothetical protein